jgi:hypothetical protein
MRTRRGSFLLVLVTVAGAPAVASAGPPATSDGSPTSGVITGAAARPPTSGVPFTGAAARPPTSGGVPARPFRLALVQPEGAPYVPPGASPAPAPEPRRPLTRQWWFWAAIGGVVVTTVAVVLLASGSSSPPGSTLGDMQVFGGR